ncbi:hypothetical protein B0H10DRAFT_1757825, partial [Mycena sp. CBHHK59/15]
FTLLIGPVFVARLMVQSTIPVSEGGYHLPWWSVFFYVIYVPAFILFGYYFAIMKLYAL